MVLAAAMRGKTRGRIQIGADDPSLTGAGGMLAVTELCERLGLIAALDAAMGPVKQRRRGFTGGQGHHLAAWSTAGPGVERAPYPAVSHVCGTWKPRHGPRGGVSRVAVGRSREGRNTRRERMAEKRMPAAERQREYAGSMPLSSGRGL